MKLKSVILTLLFTSVLLTSCGVSRQASSNLNVAQTQVVLSKNNYRVIGTVSGKSTQGYFVCFGGLSTKSCEQSAVNDMYNNADLLGSSRAVINTSVVYKLKSYLVYNEVTCIATGTLIEFIDEKQ